MKSLLQVKKSLIVLIIVFLLLGILFSLVFRNISADKKEIKQTTENRAQTPYDRLPQAPTMNMEKDDMHHQVQTEVLFDDHEIHIVNEDPTDLKDCDLELNPGMIKKGYVFRKDVLPSHKIVTIPLEKFTREGVAFTASHTEAHNLLIMCSNVTGKNGWSFTRNN